MTLVRVFLLLSLTCLSGCCAFWIPDACGGRRGLGEVVPFKALKTADGISFAMADSDIYQKNYLESFSVEKVVGEQRIVFWSIEQKSSPNFRYAEFNFPLKYGQDVAEIKVIVSPKTLEPGVYQIRGFFLFQGYKEPNDRPAFWDKVFASGTFNVE